MSEQNLEKIKPVHRLEAPHRKAFMWRLNNSQILRGQEVTPIDCEGHLAMNKNTAIAVKSKKIVSVTSPYLLGNLVVGIMTELAEENPGFILWICKCHSE